MDDRYPSTTDAQAVHLDYEYPDVARDLNRWLPLVKWLLVIPHVAVLVALTVASAVDYLKRLAPSLALPPPTPGP